MKNKYNQEHRIIMIKITLYKFKKQFLNLYLQIVKTQTHLQLINKNF